MMVPMIMCHDFPGVLAVAPKVAVARVLAVIASLCLWIWTQKLLARRTTGLPAETGTASPIFDGIHQLTAPLNERLLRYPRRANGLLVAEPKQLTFGGLTLNPNARTCSVNDQPVTLTPTEFVILETLLRHPGTVYTREALITPVGACFRSTTTSSMP